MDQEIPILLTEQVKTNQPILSRLANSLNNCKSQTVTEASEVVAGQVEKLRKFSQKITEILGHIDKSKNRCLDTTRNLQEEQKELTQQVENYKQALKKNDVEERLIVEIKNLEQEYVQTCKTRISLAQSLDIKKIGKIEIEDRKSIANEVFKWVLAVIYTEPQSKFYWPNFKKQALEKDKGKDLIERLGKVSALTTKEEQRVKTQHFIEHQKEIKSALEFKKVTDDVKKIVQIAEAFRKGYNIEHRIGECKREIEKHKEMTMEKDQENLRSEARINAIQGRIEVNQSFLSLLNITESNIASKKVLYEEKAKNGEQAIEELDQLNCWTPKINLQANPTHTCESCRLF